MRTVETTTRVTLAFVAFIFAGCLRFGAAMAVGQHDQREALWLRRSAGAVALVGIGLLCSAVQW